jgi:hypothetical protein
VRSSVRSWSGAAARAVAGLRLGPDGSFGHAIVPSELEARCDDDDASGAGDHGGAASAGAAGADAATRSCWGARLGLSDFTYATANNFLYRSAIAGWDVSACDMDDEVCRAQ